ncbi:hypothetical protein AALO_G00204330 [Alosa alosa]|uniref:Ig-like domain-containing protein n=1 Tax=Alosa alosa TaxID=278164 RepID=A0AAV6G3D6_9TELE|nr:hypothetical protein AALO_G00204330 [Alosa alosa]
MAVLALVSVFCFCVTSVAGQYYTPSIQLISSYAAVSPRETVHISCEGLVCSDYRFACLYRNGVVIDRLLCHYRSSVTFTVFIMDASNTGFYTCAFSPGYYKSSFISITVVVLQKPSISLETSKEVSWGQSAQMRCSISTQHLGGTFTLQQLSGSFRETKISTVTSALFTIPQVDFIHEGAYYCRYQTRVSRREFTSPQSATVSVIVVLEQPILSLGTSKEVSWGQSAQMRCSISTQHLDGTFTLQQLSGSFKGTKISTGASALFTIPQVDFIHEGDYYCRYQTRVSTREFTSPQSATVSLSVIVVLVQPNISLSAPDGGLFWGPQGPEVTRGHSLSLICSTEPQHQGGSFHLIFDGSNRTRTQLRHQPLSLLLHSSSPAPIIASGVISGLFLLLLIPVIFYLVKKKCSSHSSANTYGHGQGGSPDEDENIYMNVVMPADQRDHGKDTDEDLEEDYANVEELRRPAAVENDYEEDDIYQL